MVESDFMMPTGGAVLEAAYTGTAVLMDVSTFRQVQPEKFITISTWECRLSVIIGKRKGMQYQNVEHGIFLERPNRFIAYADISGKREKCHVKNTGRCRELLVPGTGIFVQRAQNPDRKTKYDLIAVEKGEKLVNMDSQIPNQVVREWLEHGGLFRNITRIRPEMRYGDSRLDLYLEADGKHIFMEIKGVTLEEDGIARFPDAPTERGIKHLHELVKCHREGYEAFMMFVIQMKGVQRLEPNDRTHPAFGEALREAEAAGVQILAYDCLVTADTIELDQRIEVRL